MYFGFSGGTVETGATSISYVAGIVPEAQMPPVQTTSIPNPHWPASRADAVNRGLESTMPEPRLPGPGGSGGSGT